MPRRVGPSYHPPRWVIYGHRVVKAGRYGPVTSALHRENIHAEAEAIAQAMAWAMKYPNASMVVVKLDRNIDANGERHVIARYGGGKTWWE